MDDFKAPRESYKGTHLIKSMYEPLLTSQSQAGSSTTPQWSAIISSDFSTTRALSELKTPSRALSRYSYSHPLQISLLTCSGCAAAQNLPPLSWIYRQSFNLNRNIPERILKVNSIFSHHLRHHFGHEIFLSILCLLNSLLSRMELPISYHTNPPFCTTTIGINGFSSLSIGS